MCAFGNATNTQDLGRAPTLTRSTGNGNVKPMAHTPGNPGGGDSLAIFTEGLGREIEVA